MADFIVKNSKIGISDLSRRIGYVIIDTNERQEYNMVRKLSFASFPRFHIYLKQNIDSYSFSIHLDQKQPIYKSSGVHAHNGEYFGPIIDEEIDRIKNILENRDSE